jgi:hypothetical protein
MAAREQTPSKLALHMARTPPNPRSITAEQVEIATIEDACPTAALA